MPSEDVLERAERILGSAEKHLPFRNLIEALAAEVRELRADLVWAVRHGTSMLPSVKMVAYNEQTDLGAPVRKHAKCDGTTDSICRAVREARDGVS